MRNKKNSKHPSLSCPYCHKTAILRPATFVYGAQARKDEQLYVCPNYPACNTYVGVHSGTTKPKGTLANGNLRNSRIRAHRVFDQIWKSGIMTRDEAYQWMRFRFGLNAAQAHIGQFSDYYCNQLIAMSEELLERNNRPVAV